MCGIVGAVGAKIGHFVSDPARYTEALRHRGPDGTGVYIGRDVFLGHRRLSIIDVEGGKQPMFNEDRSMCIVFNGEIYNYRELRAVLVSKGHYFATRSDTETILHAYEEYGDKCVERLRGMFAFAIWNEKSRSLLLARDRFGIKPVFYAHVDGAFVFASEIKAILKIPGFSSDMCMEALYSYFSLSYIPAPLTIYTSIRKLAPGHFIKVNDNGVVVRQYWDLAFACDRKVGKLKETATNLVSRIDEAVRIRMVSDVPLGAFLSGGVDSGTVVAMMSRHSAEPVRTFCIGFGGTTGSYLDERRYARQVAKRYKAMHREFEVTPYIISLLGELAACFDEPFADAGAIPNYYLCEQTARHVTVALSGLGGDELFGGYERYLGFRLGSIFRRLPALLRERLIPAVVEKLREQRGGNYTISHLKRFVRSASLPDKERYFGYVCTPGTSQYGELFIDPNIVSRGREQLDAIMSSYYNSRNATDPLDKVFYLDIKTYLPDDILALTDRVSMRHSLEVRVPFLDHHLVEYCATIPADMKVGLFEKKIIFRKAVEHLLPAEIFRHRKQGFIGPMSMWLRTDLKNFIFRVLDQGALARQGIFRPDAVLRVLNAHCSRRENYEKLIWELVMFQVWFDKYSHPFIPDDVKSLFSGNRE